MKDDVKEAAAIELVLCGLLLAFGRKPDEIEPGLRPYTPQEAVDAVDELSNIIAKKTAAKIKDHGYYVCPACRNCQGDCGCKNPSCMHSK